MKNIDASPFMSGSAANIFAHSDHNKFMPRIALEAPDASTSSEPPKGAFTPSSAPKETPPSDDKKSDDKKSDDANKGAGDQKPSDEAAKLLKENMKKKEQIAALETTLKRFDGIDPDEVKTLLEEKKAAEKAKKDAEKKAAEAAGDIERVKQMMADEHKKELDSVSTQLEETRQQMARRDAQINDLTIGQAFSNSSFVLDELVLTPSKTRAVYGAHFDYEDGKVVAYDKPAGQGERTKIVDARGEPMSFESALRKLVENDPDRDHVLKSKLAAGANAKPGSAKSKSSESDSELFGSSRIASILSKGAFGKTKN